MASTASSNLLKNRGMELIMQFIFGGAAAASCSTSPKAVAPVVTNTTLTIAAAAGITAANVFLGTAGASAPYSGFVSKTISCDAVKLVVSYLVGDDCDPCTDPDALTTVDETITIPASASGVALPAGYISKITAQVVDSAGLAKNSALGGNVQFTSSRAGVSCGSDVVIPA
jgi:hypothetical protein